MTLWSLSIPLTERLTNSATIWRSIGQISGLLGMSFLTGNIILSARFKFLDRWFKGLNFVYQDHHWLGTFSFCLLLVHPLALAVRLLSISLYTAAQFLIPDPKNIPAFEGTIALLLMITVLVMTYHLRPSYQRWLISHKFLGVVFVLGFLHTISVPSDVSSFPPLLWYYTTISILAVVAILYHVVMVYWHKANYNYVISEIRKLSPELFDFSLSPTAKPLSFRGGQFGFFIFRNAKLPRESHPYSIAGIDQNGKLRVIVKKLGDLTNDFDKLAVGDKVMIDGPYGFFGRNISGPQLWIAGGIGITPFLSLSKDASTNSDIIFIHCVKNTTEAVFSDELNNFSKSHNNRKTLEWVSDEKGKITMAEIEKIIPDWKERTILICGPVPMMDSLKKQFITMNGEKAKIITEEFSL